MLLIRKASSDSYYDFTHETNIEKLYNKYGSIVVQTNCEYLEEPKILMRLWHLEPDVAAKVSQCKLEVLIYDDYIE